MPQLWAKRLTLCLAMQPHWSKWPSFEVKIAAAAKESIVGAACVQPCEAVKLKFRWVAKSGKIAAALPLFTAACVKKP